MVERATWWASSGPCAHGSDWETGSSIDLVEKKLGRVPRWCLCSRGPPVIWWGNWDGCLGGCLCSRGPPAYDETGMGASVDAFALGDRLCIGYWDGCLGGCLCFRGQPVTYWIKCDYGWCLGGRLCSRGPVVLWIKRAWWPLEIVV